MVSMKGMDKLREMLPDYPGKKKVRFVFYVVIVIFTTLLMQLVADSLPQLFPIINFLQILAPFTPIIGSAIILSVGLVIVYNYWRVKEKLLNSYGNKAYQKSFKNVIVGIPMVFSFIIHSFFPSDLLSQTHPNQLAWILGIPITSLIPSLSEIFFVIRIVLWIFFLGLGLCIIWRSLEIFGLDNMALIYVYYPKESNLQKQEIYSILRHPTYHGLMIVIISAIFLRFSFYSLIFLAIYMIGISIHIKFVEEKELIKRFGESYLIYIKNVPALVVRIRDLKVYFRFLFNLHS
jgi:protein-S-isoprenylcysteine O-methyltransferase Ste14